MVKRIQCVNCANYHPRSWHCMVVVGKKLNPDYEENDRITGRPCSGHNPKYLNTVHPAWYKVYNKALKKFDDDSDKAKMYIPEILNKNNDCKLYKSNWLKSTLRRLF